MFLLATLPSRQQTCTTIGCTTQLKIHHVIFNFTVTIIFSFQCLKTIKNKYTLCYKTFPVSRINKKTNVSTALITGGQNTGVVHMVQRHSVSGKQDFKLPNISCRMHRVGIFFTLNSNVLKFILNRC